MQIWQATVYGSVYFNHARLETGVGSVSSFIFALQSLFQSKKLRKKLQNNNYVFDTLIVWLTKGENKQK